MANHSPTITRKDIAQAVGLSPRTVGRKEKMWRLNECRSTATRNPALYFREDVNRVLILIGVLKHPIH